eukprot:SAG31_NODE_2280_length_6025_cov_8.850321_6_plen_157_part_00
MCWLRNRCQCHFTSPLQCVRDLRCVLQCAKLWKQLSTLCLWIIDEAAEAQGVMLQEGMWSRFFPATEHCRSLLEAGAIGTVKFLQADFGVCRSLSPSHCIALDAVASVLDSCGVSSNAKWVTLQQLWARQASLAWANQRKTWPPSERSITHQCHVT